MKPFIELGARVGAAIRNVCANVDFEVVSLPGGSLIAVLLGLYALRGRSVLRHPSAESPLAIRRAPQHQHHPLAIDQNSSPPERGRNRCISQPRSTARSPTTNRSTHSNVEVIS